MGDKETEELQQKIKELYADIVELTTQLNWLKKNLELKSGRNERLQMLEPAVVHVTYKY